MVEDELRYLFLLDGRKLGLYLFDALGARCCQLIDLLE